MTPAIPAEGSALLLPPLAAMMATPVCIIRDGTNVLPWRIEAANRSWSDLAARLGAGNAASRIDDVFPGLAGVWMPVSPAGPAVTYAAVCACETAIGASTWFDLECLAHDGAPGAVVVLARDVTDAVLARREAEDAQKVISATDARLMLAQDATGIGIWEWDIDAGAQSWSPGQFRLFGLDPAKDELPALEATLQAIHPDDREALIEAARSPDAHVRQYEFRLRRLDTGETRWMLAALRVTARHGDGRPRRLAGVNIDVTHRRMAQDALRESEAQLRLAVDAAGLFAWDWDVPSGRVSWMEGLEAALGMAPGGFGGTVDAFRALVHPDDAAIVETALGRALQGETARYKAEFRMRRADGTWRWTCTEGLVLRDAQGAPARVVGVDFDITERRREQAALQDSEARLRLAMAAGGLGAWELDPATGRQIWDGTIQRLMRMPVEALNGEPGKWLDLIHPEDRDRVAAARAASLRSGMPYRQEFRVLRGDGAQRIIASRAIMAPNGRLVGVAEDVTEAREAEMLMRESEQRFQGLFDSMFQFAVLLGADGTVLKANRAVLEFGGLTTAQVIGRTIWDTIWFSGAGDAADRVKRAVAHARAGKFVRYEQTVQGTAREVTVDFLLRPVRDKAGAVILLVAEGHDITALKAGEAALRSAKQRLRLAVDAAGLATWDVDPVTSAGRWSASFFQLVGLPPDPDGHAQVEAWRALVDPGDLATIDRDFAAALAGAPYYSEHRLRRADTGEERWFAARGCILRNAAGEPERFVGVYQDVTDARRDRAASAAREHRMRSLIDALPVHAFSANAEGRNDFKNRSWCEFAGQDPLVAAGLGWADMLHPDDRGPTLQAWRHAVATGEQYEVLHRVRDAAGQFRWFLARAVRRPDGGAQSGAALRWFGGSVDVSGLMAANEGASRRVAELEALLAERTRALTDAGQELAAEVRRRGDLSAAFVQAQKLEALGHLTGSVAHDFNNVLAAIVGSYSLIRRRTASADILAIVGRGEKAASRAARLIGQLLSFARREAPAPELLDAAAVLRELEDLICHAAGPDIVCRFDLPDAVWPVLADPHQLGVAVLNLTVNARDAMPQGGTVTISVHNDRRPNPASDEHVTIVVHDTGHGMPPDVLARAREAYFTTKKLGHGTGLGLPMVHDFAQASGGAMTIESAPGVGTTVRIALPRAAVLPSSPERKSALRVISAPSFALHGNASILLVEDDDQVRPLTALFLRDLGYTVTEAANAEAALAIVHSVPRVDLLITDINLPGDSGMALARRLHAERPALPVLFVTGRIEGFALPAGATTLHKPFTDTALARAVLARLGRKVSIDPAQAEPLLSRIRSPALRDMLMDWHTAKADGEGYPRLAVLDPAAHGLAENSFSVAVEFSDPPLFHYIHVGKALIEELARARGGELISPDYDGAEIIGTLDGAYRRCARTSAPVYQAANFNFGEGGAFHFQRLILPASDDGLSITHLLGIVLFDAPSRRPC